MYCVIIQNEHYMSRLWVWKLWFCDLDMVKCYNGAYASSFHGIITMHFLSQHILQYAKLWDEGVNFDKNLWSKPGANHFFVNFIISRPFTTVVNIIFNAFSTCIIIYVCKFSCILNDTHLVRNVEKSTIVLIIIKQQYKNPVCQIFKISIKNWKNSKIDEGISE